MAGVVLLVAAVRGRWLSAVGCVVALGIGLGGLSQGRRLTPYPTDASSSPDVRVLVWNGLAANDADHDEVFDAIRDVDADIVCLLETPAWLVEAFKEGGQLRDEWPHGWVSPRAGAGVKLMLSRWPQRSAVDGADADRTTMADGLREAVVDRPGGAFTMILFDATSPRSPKAWSQGNAIPRIIAGRDPERTAAVGLPLIAAGDLNGGPASHRSRALAGGLGLTRSKPLAHVGGTFPRASVWPFDVAVDDVFTGRGAEALSWKTVALPGSDHYGVVVDLALPDVAQASR